jgi:hypothetical protein
MFKIIHQNASESQKREVENKQEKNDFKDKGKNLDDESSVPKNVSHEVYQSNEAHD